MALPLNPLRKSRYYRKCCSKGGLIRHGYKIYQPTFWKTLCGQRGAFLFDHKAKTGHPLFQRNDRYAVSTYACWESFK
jgi:hypothetical protein